LVPSLARLTRRLILGLWLVWAAYALADACRQALAERELRAQNVLPCRWHFGLAAVDRLQRCLAGVEGLLPGGSVVLFDSPAGPVDARFYRWRWAAYLLPDLEVAMPEDGLGARTAAYAIGYHRVPAAPAQSHLDLSRRLDGCLLFRIVRP
jgi:hypothetical protein